MSLVSSFPRLKKKKKNARWLRPHILFISSSKVRSQSTEPLRHNIGGISGQRIHWAEHAGSLVSRWMGKLGTFIYASAARCAFLPPALQAAPGKPSTVMKTAGQPASFQPWGACPRSCGSCVVTATDCFCSAIMHILEPGLSGLARGGGWR